MKKSKRSSQTVTSLRMALLAACIGWFTQKFFRSELLPSGPPKKMLWEDRPSYASVDYSNDSLLSKRTSSSSWSCSSRLFFPISPRNTSDGKLSKIYEREAEGKAKLLKCPETVFFDDNGTMYTITKDNNLISLTDFQTDENGTTTAKTTLVKAVGAGRPLGAAFSGDTLYMADTVMGLTRIQNVHDPKSKVQVVATRAMDDEEETRIVFADDVAIGPKTGNVYFSDGTFHEKHVSSGCCILC